MSELDIQLDNSSTLKKAGADYRDRKNISVFGVLPFAKSTIISQSEKAIVMCADVSSARVMYDSLSSMGKRVAMLPAKEDDLTFTLSKSAENIIERLRCFYLALTDLTGPKRQRLCRKTG